MSEFRQILGIRFYAGPFEDLLDLTARGGLIVVPSAPVLVNLKSDPAHGEALEKSDFAITDSGYMVALWLLLRGRRLPRISGLRFLRGLLRRADFCAAGATFWVMPTADDSRGISDWLRKEGVGAGADARYLAPMYPAGRLEDRALLEAIEARRPRYVILNIGGGVQERLGYYLRTHLSYRPAILCTGAAIGFLAGRQVGIPVWADRMVLGWLFRSIAHPLSFPPRLWKSLRLAALIWKYGERSPHQCATRASD